MASRVGVPPALTQDTGFGYDFNTLDNGEEASELSRAFGTLFGAPVNSRQWLLLQAWIPPLRLIVRSPSLLCAPR